MVCKTDHILLPTVFSFFFFLTLESSASCLHGGHCSFCVRREFFFLFALVTKWVWFLKVDSE